MANPTSALFLFALARSGFQAPRILVETGTYRGKTSLLASRHFQIVHTIELSRRLFRRARRRLKPAGVVCHLGDSRVLVPRLCAQFTEPVAWYLDAHFFRDPQRLAADNPLPLMDELTAIASRPWPDIVIVDDVHDFGRVDHGLPGWDAITQDSICDALGRVRESRIVDDQLVIWRNHAV